MLKVLTGLGIATLGVAAISPVTVVCNNDNTIDVTVAFDKPATVLEFKYGSCNKDNVRANLTQNASFGWNFQLDVTACGMDNKLRTLKYNQTALMRVGRKSGNTELSLAHFDIDSYCTYTSTYVVKYDYGELKTESHKFESDAGLINLTFSLKSYNKNYSKEEKHSTKAGEVIHLGLSITNDKFDHATDIFSSKTGKIFAPKSCEVKDENSQGYTLFDHAANDCKNNDVDFSVSYSQTSNMWRFSHMLFLIGNHRTSKLSLECVVIVCDKSRSADCDAVVKACIVHPDCGTDGEFLVNSQCKGKYTCKDGKKSAIESCPQFQYYDAQKVCTTILPSTCKDPRCEGKQDGDYHVDDQCKSKYTCAGGFSTTTTCPQGKYYDLTTKKCIWTAPSGCKDPRCANKDDGDYLVNNLCKGKFNCADGFYTLTNCPTGQYYNTLTAVCQSTVPSGCQDPRCIGRMDGNYHDDTKCNTGYQCSSGFALKDFNCPSGQYFNTATAQCQYNPPSGCLNPMCNGRQDKWYHFNNMCTSGYSCKAGVKTDKTCQSGQQFNLTSGTCVTEGTVPGCQHPKCSDRANGAYTDNTACDSGYQCSAGFLTNPVQCPSGYYYSTATYMCQQGIPDGCLNPVCSDKGDGNYKHDDDVACTSYYECKSGKKFSRTCLSGTFYDQSTGICGDKVPTGCHHPDCLSQGDGHYRDDSSSCNRGYTCRAGTKTEIDCKDKYFQAGECVVNFMGCERPVCQGKVVATFATDDITCKTYGLCLNEKWMATFKCPPGEFYSQALKGCQTTLPDGCTV